jgi:hypothetical protein
MSEMMLQACCAGYGGSAVTVYSMLDNETDALIVSKVAKEMRRDRFKECGIVTNTKIDVWESWFTDDNMPDAIAAYQRRVSEARITFREHGRQADPNNALQVAKVAEKGRAYEVSPDISSAQVAVLMLCWHVDRASAIKQSLDFGDRLIAELQGGGIVSF